MTDKPLLVLSQGDPRGVGPEIILKALEDPEIKKGYRLVIAADTEVITKAEGILGKKLHIPVITQAILHEERFDQPAAILPVKLSGDWNDDRAVGKQMGVCIDTAIHLCLSGVVDGMVTAPIEKTLLHLGGFKFDGHTEMLQERAGVERVVMMMSGQQLKVALVTIHIPLKEIFNQITTEKILETMNIVRHGLLNFFGYSQPKIAVAGLNPHASDHGLFGKEEEKIITPALDVLGQKGWLVEGPISPDTVFRLAANGRYDCVIAMYHDQGLIPFKMVHFTNGVNVTLGLPFVRTSPDHGVAYDIAMTGRADPSSMIEAIRLAGSMSQRYARRQAETIS